MTKEIEVLRRMEFVVETNSGTFGNAEACRKVGTADPGFATRLVYESVGGERRATGPSQDNAPGYTRYVNAAALASARKKLAELIQQKKKTVTR